MNTDHLLSIVIPCFNQGIFLQEALDSIKEEEIQYPFEIIIVNDGSTDLGTIQIIDELSKSKRVEIIHQTNMGLAMARNNGIAMAKGKYILPLDADNKITSDYINKSVEILASTSSDIVYAIPIFFGEKIKSRTFDTLPFSIYSLLENNFIDACAFFKKEVWIKNGGYDSQMPFNGYEDWEFWINAFANGANFHFIKKKLFYYRIHGTSMANEFSTKEFVLVHQYLMKKHVQLYLYNFKKLGYIKKKYEIDINLWMLAPFIFLFYKMRIMPSPFKKADKRFGYYKDEILIR